jgi:hypothetical protein
MTRKIQIGLVAALGLLALAGGSAALAFNVEGPNAERVVKLLDDAGVTIHDETNEETPIDTTDLDLLADVYGLGGAVRILAFADAAGVEPSVVAEMRADGMGWGEIARALAEDHEEFDLKPGIGWIMRGQGQGQGLGQGQGQGHGQGGGGAGD